jgi:hypothetical protein
MGSDAAASDCRSDAGRPWPRHTRQRHSGPRRAGLREVAPCARRAASARGARAGVRAARRPTSSNVTGRYEWAIGSDPLCATLFVLSRSWPIPKHFLPAIDQALAKHSWARSQLVEIVWKCCPNVSETGEK